MSELRFKQALVLLGLLMFVFVYAIVWPTDPKALAAKLEEAAKAEITAESAALSMTVGQLETFRADLAAKAMVRDSKGMADVLVPVLVNQCRRLPVGHPDRPDKALCDLPTR